MAASYRCGAAIHVRWLTFCILGLSWAGLVDKAMAESGEGSDSATVRVVVFGARSGDGSLEEAQQWIFNTAMRSMYHDNWRRHPPALFDGVPGASDAPEVAEMPADEGSFYRWADDGDDVWFQWEFYEPKLISKVLVSGSVTKFELVFSRGDNVDTRTFTRPHPHDDFAEMLDPPAVASVVRLIPQEWLDWPAVRATLYGYPHYQLSKQQLPRKAPVILHPFTPDQDGSISVLERAVFEFQIAGVGHAILDMLTRNLCSDYRYRNLDISFLRALDAAKSYPHEAFDIAARSGEGVKGLIHLSVTMGDARVCEPRKKGLLLPECPRNALRPQDRPTDTWSAADSFEPWRCRCKFGYEAVFQDGTAGELLLSSWVDGPMQYAGQCVMKPGYCSLDPQRLGNAEGLVIGAHLGTLEPAKGTLGEVAYVRCPHGFVPDDIQTVCTAIGDRGIWSPPVRCRFERPREPLLPTCADPTAGQTERFVAKGCATCFAGEADCNCQVGCAEGYKLMGNGRAAEFVSVRLTCASGETNCPEPSTLSWNAITSSCAATDDSASVNEWCCPETWGRSERWDLQEVDDCMALVTEVSCLGSLQRDIMTGCCWTSDQEWTGHFCLPRGPAVGDADACAVPFSVPSAVWEGELPDCRPLMESPFLDLPNVEVSSGCFNCAEGEDCDCHVYCSKGTTLVGGEQGKFTRFEDVKLPVCIPLAPPPLCNPVQREGLIVKPLDPGLCKQEAPFLRHCYDVRCDDEWRVPEGRRPENVIECFEVDEAQVREGMAADKKCENIHWEPECVTSADEESHEPCLWKADGFEEGGIPHCVPNMSEKVTPLRLPDAYAPARESALEPLPECQPLCPNRFRQYERVDVENCKDCFQGEDPKCKCTMTCKAGFHQVGGPPSGPRMCEEPSLKSGALLFPAPPVCRADPSTRCPLPEIAFAVPTAGCASCSAEDPEACECAAQCIATHRMRTEGAGSGTWKGTCIMQDQTHELRPVHSCEDVSMEEDCVGEAPLWRGSVDERGNPCCWRQKGLWDAGPQCAARGHEGMEFVPSQCAELTVPNWKESFPDCVERCQNQDVSRLVKKLDIDLVGCDDCVCGDQGSEHTESDTKIAGCQMKCRDGYEKVGTKSFPAPGAATCNAIASGKDDDLPQCMPRCDNDLASVNGLAPPPASCSECVAGQECDCEVHCKETHLKVGSWSAARRCTDTTLSLSNSDGSIFCMEKPPVPECPSLELPGLVISGDRACGGDEACLRKAKVSCNEATHLASNPAAQGDFECRQVENQALGQRQPCTLVGNRNGCIHSKDADSGVPCCWQPSGLLGIEEKCAPMWGAKTNFLKMPQECALQFAASWGELPNCQARCRSPLPDALAVLGVLLRDCAACVADEPCNCKASCDAGKGFQRVDSDEEEQRLSCTASRLDFVLPVCLSVPPPVCDPKVLMDSTTLQVAGGQPEGACQEALGSTCKIACAPRFAIPTVARFAPAANGRSDGVTIVTCQSRPAQRPEDTCSRFHGSMKQCLQHNDEPSDGISVPCCWVDGGGNACVPKGTESIGLKGSVTGCTAQFEGVWGPALPTCYPVCKNDIAKRHKFVKVVGCEDPIVEDDEDALCGVECAEGAVMTNYKCGVMGKSCPPVELVCRHGALAPKRSKDKFPICLPLCPDIIQSEENNLDVTGCRRCWPNKPGCECDVKCHHGAVHVGKANAGPGGRKCILSDDGTARWDKLLPQCVAQCQPPPPNPFMDTSNCDKACSVNDPDCTCSVSCKTRKPQITTLKCVVSSEGIPEWDGEMPACSSIGVHVVDGMTAQKLVGALLTLRDLKTGEQFGVEQLSNTAGEVIWHTKMANFKVSASLEGYFGQAHEFEWSRDCISDEQSSAACVVTMALIRISELATGDKDKGQHGHFGEMDKRSCTMFGSASGAYYVASAALNWRARAVDLDLWVRAQSGRRTAFTCGRKPGDRRKLDAKSLLVKHRYAKNGDGLCKAEQCCVLNPQLKRSVPPGQDCTGCVRDTKSSTGCRRLGVDKGNGQFCHKGCCDYLSSCLMGADALKDVNPQMTSSECGTVHRNQYPTWISGKSGARLIHTLEEYKKWEPCTGDGSMCNLKLEADIMEGGGVPEFARMENLPPGIYQVVANIYRPDDSYDASNDIVKAKPRITLSLGIQELHKSPRKVDFECEISDDCRVAGATIWHVATIHVSEGKLIGGDGKSYRYAIRILDSGPTDPQCQGSEDIDSGCMPKLDVENFPTQTSKQSEERAKGSVGSNWVEPDYFVPNYAGMYHQRQLLENVCYGKCRAAEGSTDFESCLFSSGVPRP